MTVASNAEALRDALDDQVVLESELWRAISTQEGETNALVGSFNSAHMKAFRDTHNTLTGFLDDLELRELQLRELAVLDEFERRVQESTEYQADLRTGLCSTVQEARDNFAETLKADLEKTKRAKANEASAKCNRNGGAPLVVRGMLKLVRVAVAGVLPLFLAKEAFRVSQNSGGLRLNQISALMDRMGRRRSDSGYEEDDEDETIHSLPAIAIPTCGTRDTVMSTTFY
ncbi:hypothetical protein A3770_06p42560 [Chloropicon primus]|uniref:Uncharacterized protein n=1 Tax=Chloropicon primus TaxID=1764295 RepID=A0A5B8MM67_9CHLO|nr:hypothetical protein A3770_06p42560 [Chloropicon primus]|eukprot:QDZ21738.1 hypothetical protein A3770_06p42560 [Chloropicon primus]